LVFYRDNLPGEERKNQQPYDHFRDRTLAGPVCHPIIHSEIYNPRNEVERYCYKFAKKHTDTVHLLGMSTVNDSDGITLLGLYRTDEKFGFSQKDKTLYQQVGPLLRSTSKQLMLYQQWDLKRQTYDKLFETADIRPVFMDNRLRLVDLPLPTLSFLRSMFNQPLMEGLPSRILNTIEQLIAPEGEIVLGTGPWSFRVKAVRGDIICHAHVMATENKQPVLIIRFEQHGASDDFSQLSSIGLTKREIETISYLPLGYTNKQIAMAMSIGEDGVKQHLKRLSIKLGASGRTEILFQALEMKKSIQLYGSVHRKALPR
jgi:DNA-binding CsgD family transcriptional regulator